MNLRIQAHAWPAIRGITQNRDSLSQRGPMHRHGRPKDRNQWYSEDPRQVSDTRVIAYKRAALPQQGCDHAEGKQ